MKTSDKMMSKQTKVDSYWSSEQFLEALVICLVKIQKQIKQSWRHSKAWAKKKRKQNKIVESAL